MNDRLLIVKPWVGSYREYSIPSAGGVGMFQSECFKSEFSDLTSVL